MDLKLQTILKELPFILNKKQLGFLEHYITHTGHAVLQGLAGTGKSLMMLILSRYYGDEIVFLGSTGVSSQNLPYSIGIGTAHSYLSMPTKPATELDYRKISSKCSGLFAKSDKVKIAVVDEAFFLNSDNLDIIWRRLERFNKKSGKRHKRDIRLLLVGDTGQCVTIADDALKRELKLRWGSHLMFKSTVWDRFNFTYYVFDHIERQEDKIFKACLDVIRYNQVDRFDKCLSWLNQRVEFDYDKNQMILAATNKTVDRHNQEVLDANPNHKIEFKPIIKGSFNMKDVLVREDGITLCEGLPVMTVNNDADYRWVNGSTGIVTSVDIDGAYVLFDKSKEEHYVARHTWTNKEVYTAYETDDDGNQIAVLKEKTLGTLEAVPLLISAALTISKAQGLTIFKPFVLDFEDDWLYANKRLGDFGMNFVYLGLSRGVDINNITLARPVTKRHLKCSQDSIDFWNYCCERSVI